MSFDPKKANKALRAKQPHSKSKHEDKENVKPVQISHSMTRKANLVETKKQVDQSRRHFFEEEKKYHKILEDFVKHRDFDNLDKLDLPNVFKSLTFFLSKNEVGGENALTKFLSSYKPFTLDQDSLTSIQQLIRFIQRHKNLRDLYGKYLISDEIDLFGDEDLDLDPEKSFDDFFTLQDNIETKKAHASDIEISGIEQPKLVGKQKLLKEFGSSSNQDSAVIDEGVSQFKEIQQKWNTISKNVNKQIDKPSYHPKIIKYDRSELLEIFRNRMAFIKQASSLRKYFSEDDSNKILNEIYNRVISKKGTLNDYFIAIARIVVFVDDEYLKSIAKTFNKKLAKQYYNLESLLDLTISEILQEIYQHPDNRQSISSISTQIDDQIEKCVQKMTRQITREPYNEEEMEKTKKSLKMSLETIKKSPSLNKGDCSDDFSDVNDLDIIYYTDINTGTVYCFKLFDLYEQFEKDDFVNHKSGNVFSEIFVKNILSHHKKPKSPVKDLSSMDDILKTHQSSLIDIFSKLENSLEPSIKDEYIKEFGGVLKI